MSSHFPTDICELIADHSSEFQLADWVDEEKLVLEQLSENENAIDYLIEHPEIIDLKLLELNKNPRAVEIYKNSICQGPHVFSDNYSLQSNPVFAEFILENDSNLKSIQENKQQDNPYNNNYKHLSCNPHPKIIELLRKNPRMIDVRRLARNPQGFYLLDAVAKKLHPDYQSIENAKTYIATYNENAAHVSWFDYFTEEKGRLHPNNIEYFNLNPLAPNYLREHRKYIVWYKLFKNPDAIDFLKENIDDINYEILSSNPKASELFYGHEDELDWIQVSRFCEDTEFLKNNKHLLDYNVLATNPAIFVPVKRHVTSALKQLQW